MDNNSHRDRLLAKFSESIGKPMGERFFDEDELLDVFDYAGDVNDDYLRLEALMCLARFYPDSEYYLERKAIFYSQTSMSMRDRFLGDNPQAQGMIFDLLRIDSIIEEQPQEAEKMLDQVVEKYDDYTDEEIIQLISVASGLGNTDWYKRNLDKLREKSYINILLYEIAVNADSLGDIDLSVKLLEELTEIDPYSNDFWMMLAREYAGMENAEKSMQAVEYALAINPDNPEARFIKARLLFVADSHSPEVLEIMESVVKDDPNSYEYAKFLSAIYTEHGMTDKAARPLLDFYNSHKDDGFSIIPDIVMLNPPETPRLLDDFYRLTPDVSPVFWSSWAQQVMLAGNIDLAKKIFDAYTRNSGNELNGFMKVVNLFIEKKFEESIVQLDHYLNSAKYSDNEFPSMVIVHLVSMLRLGRLQDALRFCEFIHDNTHSDNPLSISGRIEYAGMRSILRDVTDKLAIRLDPDDWTDYDPLSLWSICNDIDEDITKF